VTDSPAVETARRTVAAVWRIEAARVIAGLVPVVRDVGLAEDIAQDALVAALEQWPDSGVPDNPGAWLSAVARRRGVDTIRRRVTLERKVEEIGRELADAGNRMDDIEIGPTVQDDVLRLAFVACHPVLSPEARVALTLKMIGGLSTEEIARAYLVPVPTMAQRIVRAKKALRDADVQFEIPEGADLTARVASVLEVVYLIFNEGYAATAGATWTRPALCEEAMRLGRIMCGLAPREAEAFGLVALMEIQASRLSARVAPDGTPITLMDQDRSRWDRVLINHAFGALARSRELGKPGPYVLQAEIAACHARANSVADTDWVQIATLYGELVDATESPVVELNRAVAVAMADGPGAGLAIVDELRDLPALRGYHLLPSVRGDLLVRLGRLDEARAEFEVAAELASNEREQELLHARAAACSDG
jgi:RNA polymerase sigma factor (sigma-70 family)